MTLEEEKQRIDYEIKAKKDAADKECGEWVRAFWAVILFIFFAYLSIKVLSL